jgi:hypothetical protein
MSSFERAREMKAALEAKGCQLVMVSREGRTRENMMAYARAHGYEHTFEKEFGVELVNEIIAQDRVYKRWTFLHIDAPDIPLTGASTAYGSVSAATFPTMTVSATGRVTTMKHPESILFCFTDLVDAIYAKMLT